MQVHRLLWAGYGFIVIQHYCQLRTALRSHDYEAGLSNTGHSASLKVLDSKLSVYEEHFANVTTSKIDATHDGMFGYFDGHLRIFEYAYENYGKYT